MTQPLAIDLFCGAGGVSVGLHRAGYRVIGVDLHPQKNYPFEFHQADALTFDLTGADLVWASPPCPAYSVVSNGANCDRDKWPRLIEPIREKLKAWGGPYIIENVVGSPLLTTIVLCGTMFGLKVVRHRLFESNYLLMSPPHDHRLCRNVIGKGFVTVVKGGGDGPNRLPDWRIAMGIDWMGRGEITSAIPPAYSEYLARQLVGRQAS